MFNTREDVAHLTARGLSASEVARHLGLATNTVRYHLAVLAKRPVPSPSPTAQSLIDTRAEARNTVSEVPTRAAVALLLEQGSNRADIARVLGLSKATVSYHARRLGAPVDERCARRYDWAAVQRHYDAGNSVSECVAAFGFSRQTWHAAVIKGRVISRPAAMPLLELCRADVPRGRPHLKRRLLAEGVKQAVCEECGLERWRGEAISLALHHRNGDRHDNRIENLALLCPNCHSQTPNFSGRDRRGRPQRDGAKLSAAPSSPAAPPDTHGTSGSR